MLLALLQAQFQPRSVFFDGGSTRLNCVFTEFNPRYSQVTIDAPRNELPSYVFLHASRKISDFSVYGDFGKAKETGLVWNQPSTHLFNVLMEMKAAEDAKFYIVRWAQTVVVHSSYLDVGKAVLQADVFKALSITQSSLQCAYISSKGIPSMPFVKGDAFFTSTGRIGNAPEQYDEPCEACPVASSGRGCSECPASGYLNGTVCVCYYNNYKYQDYYGDCAGTPEMMSAIFNDSIAGVDFSYFSDCASNYALYFYYNQVYTSSMKMQFFHDDACGINNIFLNGSVTTSTIGTVYSEIVGFTFTKTTSMANATITLNLRNTGQKMGLMTSFARNATGNIVFQNIILSGRADEQGSGRNDSEHFRMNVLFHTLQDVNLTIQNMTIHGAYVASYWDGVYNSIGVGVAKNCKLFMYDIYVGDKLSELVNPVLSYDFYPEKEPQANCSDKMDPQGWQEAQFHDNMPAQFVATRTSTWINCDSNDQGGLFGKLDNSTLLLNRSLIAIEFRNSYSPKQAGIIATYAVASTIQIRFTSVNAIITLTTFSGVIGKISDVNTQLHAIASLNMTSSSANSGFIGYFLGGMAQLLLILNVTFTGAVSGAIAGTFSQGKINLTGAFGFFQAPGALGNGELGQWIGGQFDNQICDSQPCDFEMPSKSYLNFYNYDGVCSPKVMTSEPIGRESARYFSDCKRNAKFKVNWEGNIESGSLTIFNPDSDCQLVNVNVTGTFKLSGNTIYYGIVLQSRMDSSTVYVDMNFSYSGGYIYRMGLVVAYQHASVMNDTIIKGSITLPNTYQSGVVGGCVGEADENLAINRLAVYGLILQLNAADKASLVIAYSYMRIYFTNIVIDDYSKAKQVPDLRLAGTLPDSYRCASGVQSEELKTALYMASGLEGANANRRSQIISLNAISRAGAVLGQVTDASSFDNVSVLVEANMANTGYRYVGMLVGFLSYETNMTGIYVEGKTLADFGSVISYLSSNLKCTMAIKVTFMKSASATFNYLGGYGSVLELAVDIEMNGPNCAGLYYQYSYATYTMKKMYGIIKKNSYYCFNIAGSQSIDSIAGMFVSNTDDCPAWY